MKKITLLMLLMAVTSMGFAQVKKAEGEPISNLNAKAVNATALSSNTTANKLAPCSNLQPWDGTGSFAPMSDRISYVDFLVDASTDFTPETFTQFVIVPVGETIAISDIGVTNANGAIPGTVLASMTGVTPVSQTFLGTNGTQDFYDVAYDLTPLAVTLTGGLTETTYWFSIQSTNTAGAGATGWLLNTGAFNFPTRYSQDNGATYFQYNPALDFNYTLTGDCVLLIQPDGEVCEGNGPTTLDGTPGTVTTLTVNIAGVGTIGADQTDMFTLNAASLDALDYNMVNELVATLTSPEGTTVTLFANDGGNSADGTPRDLVFTDASTNDVNDWNDAASFMADFMAEGGSLNDAFDGESLQGDWILTITNGGANGGGTLDDFCLDFSNNGTVGNEPTIECPMDIVADNDEDACGAIVNFADAIALDAEDGPIATTQVDNGAPASGEEFPVGVTTVTFEATDSNGNTVMCSFDVTVNDVMEPTIECPAAILMANDAGACGADVTVPTPVVTDNCEDDQPGTFINDFNGTDDASGFYPVGTTTVEFTYTDAGGNMTTCTVDVTVEDTEAPVIACEGSIEDTISETAAPAAAINDSPAPGTMSTITVTDSQTIVDVNVSLDISHAWVGDLDITLESPAGTVVTIYDRPGVPTSTFGCSGQDILATLDDEATSPVEDECGANAPVINGTFIPNNALTAFDGEDTAGDWILTVTDNAGGGAGTLNAWGLDLMYDATPLPPFVVELDADGLATIDASDLLISATDNCTAMPTITVGSTEACSEANASNAFQNGGNITSGGAFSGANDLTVADGQNFNLNQVVPNLFHNPGETIASATFTYYDDNAGVPGAIIGSEAGVVPSSQTVVGGNFGFDTSTVTFDVTPFEFLGQDGAETTYWIQVAATSSAGGPVFWEVSTATGNGNPQVTSNDGGASWTPFVDGATGLEADGVYEFNGLCSGTNASMIDFTCAEVGLNTIEVTATDASGNEATCEAIVDVQDNTDPVIVCQDFTLELGDDGTAVLDPLSLLDDTMTVEACGFDVVTADVTNFDCSNIGTPTMVTIFVQDPSGNIASCSAMVTVVDVNGPVLTCPDDQVRESDPATGTYTVEDFTGLATATDGCSATPTIAQDPAVGTELGVGSYTVTLTATDDLGNMSTCTFNLQVDFLGVDENELSNAIAMYPNPATAIVNLSNTSNIALDRAAIYDVNGKMVSDVNLDGLIGERAIDVSALATGVYIVQISGEGTTIAKRLIIE